MTNIQRRAIGFIRSVWLFPAILTLILGILVTLGISGSSIGFYHELFYGGKDPSLLFNQPRDIRSDEWLVDTQATAAQAMDNYSPINKHIGNGQDMAVLGDLPYKSWSLVFKPQNLAYLALPFDNAFAFHWWLIGYLLILSVYFFAYLYLPAKFPKRILLAILLSLAFFFSPFIQWWYLTGTLGPIYYSLFGLVALKLLLRTKKPVSSLLLGVLLAYIIVCFSLILYPPFQIPCAIVSCAVALPLLLNRTGKSSYLDRRKAAILVASAIVSLSLVALFLYQHRGTVATINSTAYPGHRVVASGGSSVKQFFANHLGGLLQSDTRAAQYTKFVGYPTNQSESSSFILLLPFTIPALAVLTYISIKNYGVRSYASIALIVVAILFAGWLFVPHLGLVGKLTLLDKVPQGRMLIGVGLLNLVVILEFMRSYGQHNWKVSRYMAIGICAAILFLYLIFDWLAANAAPGFVAHRWAILFAIPVPLAIFCLLEKRFVLAAATLFLFSFISTYRVNPLYRGTDILRESKLSTAIQGIATHDTRRWITDTTVFENMAAANGANSLGGTYLYPQNTIWQSAFPKEGSAIYNRYAHVIFMLNRDASVTTSDKLQAVGDDQFWVETEPCSITLQKLNVGYIITTNAFPSDPPSCLQLSRQIVYPRLTVYIYEIRQSSP